MYKKIGRTGLANSAKNEVSWVPATCLWWCSHSCLFWQEKAIEIVTITLRCVEVGCCDYWYVY